MEQRDKAVATLGGGCFWCLEAAFERLRGVEQVVSGYAGGSAEDAHYQRVCSGRTGHAEVVRITYDPQTISFGELLEVFFTLHDPTSQDRQGADVGPQYRSVIFYHDEGQRAEAERLIGELERAGAFPKPIVTERRAAPAFYPAEDYHQGYYRRHGGEGYCQMVIAPKLNALRRRFARWLESGP